MHLVLAYNFFLFLPTAVFYQIIYDSEFISMIFLSVGMKNERAA